MKINEYTESFHELIQQHNIRHHRTRNKYRSRKGEIWSPTPKTAVSFFWFGHELYHAIYPSDPIRSRLDINYMRKTQKEADQFALNLMQEHGFDASKAIESMQEKREVEKSKWDKYFGRKDWEE